MKNFRNLLRSFPALLFLAIVISTSLILPEQTAFAAPPTKLVFITPARTTNTNTPTSVITIQTQDGASVPSPPVLPTVVSLSSSSDAGRFYLAAACTGAITQLVMTSASDSASFFYCDSTAGTHTVTISASGLTGSSQSVRINASPPPDLTAPSTTISTPSKTSYNLGSLFANFAGGVTDVGGSGVRSVELSLRRASDGLYWTGSIWASPIEIFLSTSVSGNSWSRSSGPSDALAAGDTYTVHVVGTDNANNRENPGPSFSFSVTSGSDNQSPAANPFNNTNPTGSGSSNEQQANQPSVQDQSATGQNEDAPKGPLANLADNLAKNIPTAVQATFPYLLLVALGIVVLQLSIQARRELLAGRKKALLLRQQELLNQERRSFLVLSSHYLRTPISVLNMSLSVLGDDKKFSAAKLAKLEEITKNLQTKARAILAKPEPKKSRPPAKLNKGLRDYIKLYISPFVILLATLLVALVVLTNLLFANYGSLNRSTLDYLTQGLALVILILLFVFFYRMKILGRLERLRVEKQIAAEQKLEKLRNKFIKDTARLLKNDITAIDKVARSVKFKNRQVREIIEAVNNLKSIQERFELFIALSGRRPNKAQVSSFKIKAMVEEIIKRYNRRLKSKKISLSLHHLNYEANQHRELLTKSIDNLIDNAIKFTPKHGKIRIDCEEDSRQLQLNVEDNGTGISKDKLALLFQPFVRAGEESSVSLNFPGMGFNLYMDQVIMRYLGGEVVIHSELHKGTTASLIFPKNVLADEALTPKHSNNIFKNLNNLVATYVSKLVRQFFQLKPQSGNRR